MLEKILALSFHSKNKAYHHTTQYLAHLVYQPKSLNHGLSVVRHRRWHHCHWYHLCTPLLATGLNNETSHLSPICAHQIFSDSDIWATETNLGVVSYLCAKMPNELGSIRTYFWLI